jgi:hypothetical protein
MVQFWLLQLLKAVKESLDTNDEIQFKMHCKTTSSQKKI